MGSLEDRSELLSQLTIDKSPETQNGISVTQLILTSVGTAFLAGFVVFFLTNTQDTADSSNHELIHNDTQTSAAEVEVPSTHLENISKTVPEQTVSTPANVTKAQQILNASGYITPRRIATVSAEIMGRITSVDVEEGMEVTAGQILAKLDDSVASVDLALAKAQLQSQQATVQSLQTDLKEAQRVLNRVKKLEDKNYSSEAQLTRAQTDVDKFSATLASAKAQYNISLLQVAKQQELLDDHTITAPFAGIITVKNAQPGEIVSPSSAGGGFTRTGICTLVDMDSLEIEVDVNEAFIGRVFSGQKVVANLDAYPEWDIPASVIAIIPTADRAKATVSVRIKIEEKDTRILPDMGVKVAFLK